MQEKSLEGICSQAILAILRSMIRETIIRRSKQKRLTETKAETAPPRGLFNKRKT
jgi:hypothetical protein